MAAAQKRLGWGLAVTLARREMRGDGGTASGRGFLSGFRIFLLCLILGIFTISAVGSLSAALVAGMVAQGQAILGGDIDFRLIHRAANKAELDWLQQNGTVSEIATMRAMVRRADNDEAMLVETKAVDGAYPLYGRLKLARALGETARLQDALAPQNGIYGGFAEQGLFDRLALEPGAVLHLGAIKIRLNGIIENEPDRNAGGFPLAPRLMVSHATLKAAGLLRPGALINYHYRLRVPDTADNEAVKQIVTAAPQEFPFAGWRIRDRSDASPSMRRFIERLGLFLTLVGLTALVVGGVGVGNAISAYLQRRRETIAVLKALGASGRFIFRIYAVQIGVLSLVALIIGLGLGAATPAVVKFFFNDLLPVELALGLYPLPLMAAGGFGLLAAAAFALWPLGQVELTPVTALFRADAAERYRAPPWPYVLAIMACFMALGALAMLISERRDVALWFALGVALAYFILRAAAGLLVWLAKRAGRPKRPELRLALANITRPQAPVRAVMLSIGLSVTLLSAIAIVDGNINAQISGDLPERTPSFFLLDIGPQQIDDVLELAAAQSSVGMVEKAAMLRGQVLSLKGIAAADYNPPPEAAWVLRGDRGLTYAARLPEGGEIVEGAWWPEDYAGPPLVSFAAEEAGELGLAVGDMIEVNVLGRPLKAEIANLRHVDWASGGMNFIMVFSPNPLQYAPHSYLASLSLDAQDEAAFARIMASDFPNVTIIRVKEALSTMRNVLNNLGLGIRAMSLVTMLAGILVLAGAMASGHRARVYDAVVMKVLGATRGRILLAFALEYALMGLGAALIAAAAGSLAAYGLIVGAMQSEFIFLPLTLASTVLGAVFLTVTLGLLGTYRALGAPAAPVLRSQ
jgi:putative ABC transport system permease protein